MGQLLHYLSMVTSVAESDLNGAIRRKLTQILELEIVDELKTDESSLDGVYMITVTNECIPLAFVERKKEVGAGRFDPSTQAGITMRRSWIQ